MRIIKIISIFITLIILSFLLPYFAYLTVLKFGLNLNYLTIPPLADSSQVIDNSDVLKKEIAMSEQVRSNSWRLIHFGNYELAIPTRHPLVRLIPTIDFKASINNPNIGLKFNDIGQEEYTAIRVLTPTTLNLNLEQGNFFSIPIVQEVIEAKKIDTIWEDLFSKKVSKLELTDFIQFRISAIVYNLYLLHLRDVLLPDNSTQTSYFKQKEMGIVFIDQNDGRYRLENLFFLRNGKIYRLELKTRNHDIFSERIRDIFLTNLNFKMSYSAAADKIYAKHKTFRYDQKVDQEGMIHLFSAWTHADANKAKYLREMIQYLERGKSNMNHLAPLYEYALRKHNSNFSRIQEDPIEKVLTKKIAQEVEEEIQEEIKEVENTQVVPVEGTPDSSQEKMDYLLKKAKIEGINTDETDDILIEE
ncbi:MAG: hypothetical protein ISR65_10025 [Bacteriovoracaceae bacterium]|nr:hypothetical protein [Bacteriovoracaceae bacterium]